MTSLNQSTKNEDEPTGSCGAASASFEPIAIIGMGMRLPGGVRNAADYWHLLVNGKSGQCRVPESRYNVDTWYGPGRANHVPTKLGYFLNDLNLARVDSGFWSFTRQEAELMDPRQRLFLEVAYEALENAGAAKFRGTDVGVYVGTMGEDWNMLESRDEQNLNQVRPDVYGDYIIANRASYEFDLTGPSIVVRTACSASLVALHMACRDLQGGECTSALVGGVNLILAPKDTTVMHQQGVLSPTASCKSFDADADGFARGEGVSVIYIKKLSDAIRDGDPIRSIIRSTCLAGNGRTLGLTTPSPKSHEKLMRRGHQLAGITDLSKTAMIECHGTGTSVGDPLEISAVANIWSEHGIHIGSVKPNIGHGEGASGLSSVIKMVLALENSTIPPNINFNKPNPNIPWETARLKVPTTPLPWPTDKLERVGVNSFGIGGSNAHVLLESAACFGVPIPSSTEMVKKLGAHRYRLLAFSAQHPDSVNKSADDIRQYLRHNPDRLEDVSHSLNSRREVHAHRAFCLTNGEDDFQVSQITRPGKTPPCLVWVFTGQGAQWPQMGRELLEQEPLARKTIRHLENVLAGLPDPPSWKLNDMLLASKGESRLDEAEFSQPCLVAIQVVLVDLLRSWGIEPKAVVGHSSGETAAAYASGAITAEEAIRIAYHRGKITLLIKATHKGSMAAVGLGQSQVEKFLLPGVMIGCENSPSNVTLSGEADVLEHVMQSVRDAHPEVLARSLRVECGYHSQHMQTAAEDFAKRLNGVVQPKKPKIPFYSSVTGLLNADFSSSYWVQNVVSPVRFNTAVHSVLDDFHMPTFVEIGPHSALAGPIRQILHSTNRAANYSPTLVRNQDAFSSILKSVGELWANGVEVDLNAVSPSGRLLTDLPTYPWHYDAEYWVETRLSRSWRQRKFDHHELLGSRVEEVSDACPAWRCNFRIEDAPWLQDHVIRGETIFPASGFISMIGEALRQLKGTSEYTIQKVGFDSALALNDRPVELVTILNRSQAVRSLDGDWYEFTISSLNEGSENWVEHVAGLCKAGSNHEQRGREVARLPRKVSPDLFYSAWKRFGLCYGASFRNLTNITSHVTEARATASLESALSENGQGLYTIHPTSLDSSMHLAMIASCLGLAKNFKQLAIPTHIGELYIGEPLGVVDIEATTNDSSSPASASRVVGVSDGRIVIDIRDLRVKAIGKSAVFDEDPHAGAVLHWKPDIEFLNPLRAVSRRDFGASANTLDKLCLACIVETRTRLQFLSATQPHLVHFKSWLDESYRQAVAGTRAEFLDAFDIANMSSEARQEFITEMVQACMGTVTENLARAVQRVYLNAPDCFVGRLDPAGLVPPWEDITDQAQEFLSDVRVSSFLRLMGHKNPGMRVLHIGGASKSDVPVKAVLNPLSSSDFSGHLYGSYLYAGRSSKPSAQIQERLESFPATTYAQLDLDIEPTSQGFTRESFDLIFRSGPKPPSRVEIKNMRKLLKSTGYLMLQHANQTSKHFRYILGLSPEHEPSTDLSTSVKALGTHLSSSGFDGSACSIFSGDHSILTITKPFTDRWRASRASVVCHDPNNIVVLQATRHLQVHGLELDFFVLGQELPWGQPVLCLLDLEGPFFHNMGPRQWDGLKNTLLSVQDENVLWVTAASQLECKDPSYALALGFARSLRRELSMDLVTLELDCFDARAWNAVQRLLDTFGERLTGGEVEPDTEYVFAHGSLQISRFHATRISDQLRVLQDSDDKRFEIDLSNSPNQIESDYDMDEATVKDGQLVKTETKSLGPDSEVFEHQSSYSEVEVRQQEMTHSDTPQRSSLRFRPDRTYVFVGGFGGLGQATARFLAERGARELIFFSRSAEESAEKCPEYFEEMLALGCTVQAISGSVDQMEDVMSVVNKAKTPIAGVMQAAMVLQDVNIADMAFDQWDATVKPKVQGTWNLHHALLTQAEPLDFFFLFSSLSGLLGGIGQANYAAANAWLDAFVQYRHSRGLACSVLDIGIMEDIGVLARETNRLDALRATAQHCLHEQDLLDAVELMIMRSIPEEEDNLEHSVFDLSRGYTNPGQVAIGLRSAATGPRKSGWQCDSRSAFLARRASSERVGGEAQVDETLKDFLHACRTDPEKLVSAEAKMFLAREIGGALQEFSMRHDGDVDLSLPLQTDSLVTVELRNWVRQKMGVSFTVLELRSAESIFALGETTATRLFAMYEIGGCEKATGDS